MRLLLAMLLGAALTQAGALPSVSEGSTSAIEQPEGQPAEQGPPATSPAPDRDVDMNAAGWANLLWIAVVVIAGIAFIALAMVGLRSRSRE